MKKIFRNTFTKTPFPECHVLFEWPLILRAANSKNFYSYLNGLRMMMYVSGIPRNSNMRDKIPRKVTQRSKTFQYDEKYLVKPKPNNLKLASKVYTEKKIIIIN